jgi:hypothetical protein
MTTFSNHFTPKNPNKFVCEKCDFCSSNKKDFTRHINTIKHLSNLSQSFLPIFTPKNPFACSCGKTYKDKSGLWRHKKKCEILNIKNDFSQKEDLMNHILSPDFTPELIKLITELVKGQNGIQESIIELCKNGTMNNSHNTTNSHNKSFNLQFFLNETCKDAMNIMDFVDSIKLQLSDLEKVGELGYIEGISNIIVKNLNEMDITLRPIHCTDKKRETTYIKDQDKWEKENENKDKMRKMVRKVANKNINLIQDYKKAYPDCNKITSKYSDKLNKIIIESMGGKGDNDYEKEEKIIKKIIKEVVLEKEGSDLN